MIYLAIVSSDTDQEVGRLADLSVAGALVLSPRALPIGAPLPVRVSLPPGLGDEERYLGATITPRWHKHDVDPRYILNGCSLVVDDGNRFLVDLLIERYAFGSGEVDLRQKYEAKKRLEY